MKNKLLSILVIMGLMLSMTACSGNDDDYIDDSDFGTGEEYIDDGYEEEDYSETYNPLISAELAEIPYNALGTTYKSMYDYYHQDEYSSVRTVDLITPDYYGTLFGNMQNVYIVYNYTGSEPFSDSDYAFAAKGWFERVFDYETEQGGFTARDMADYFGAINTYTVEFRDEIGVPSNLSCNRLYAFDTALMTAEGQKEVTIELEADGDDTYISSDTWVMVKLK